MFRVVKEPNSMKNDSWPFFCIDKQQLIFGGQQLQDKNLVLYYNIMENSTVHLQLLAPHVHTPLALWAYTSEHRGPFASFQIFIKNLRGKTFTIEVYRTDTIEIVKFHVKKLDGIPLGEYLKTGSEHKLLVESDKFGFV